MDKFAAYYNSEERIQELSEYVHQNFKLISTKMISEMRRMLDIEPNLTNSDGYVSLMVSLQGRMFNEMVYSIAGHCQYMGMSFTQIIPKTTIDILLNLIEGKNPLGGEPRTDVKHDLEGFKEYYKSQIDKLREVVEALPKDKGPR